MAITSEFVLRVRRTVHRNDCPVIWGHHHALGGQYWDPKVISRIPRVIYRIPRVIYRIPKAIYRIPRVIYRIPKVTDRILPHTENMQKHKKQKKHKKHKKHKKQKKLRSKRSKAPGMDKRHSGGQGQRECVDLTVAVGSGGSPDRFRRFFGVEQQMQVGKEGPEGDGDAPVLEPVVIGGGLGGQDEPGDGQGCQHQ